MHMTQSTVHSSQSTENEVHSSLWTTDYGLWTANATNVAGGLAFARGGTDAGPGNPDEAR